LPACYLDTSAFVKLVRSEPKSRALRDELRGAEAELISSVLLSVEGRRAARRYGKLATLRANSALTTVTLLALDEPIIEIAGELEPAELRSLDALHLATIISLGDDIERVYCYDSRLTSAARALGIEVAEPA
jgi:predicted nucleic acid-binding protein